MANPFRNARPPRERRAFSLLELAAVAAILGLLAGVAVMRWGDGAIRTVSAQGVVRSVVLSLNVARRQAISEGTSAAVVFDRTGGDVTGVTIVRAASAGDEPTDQTLTVPAGVSFTTSYDRWEYDYTGGLAAPASGGTVAISDGVSTWTLTINAVTGHVGVVQTP